MGILDLTVQAQAWRHGLGGCGRAAPDRVEERRMISKTPIYVAAAGRSTR